MARLPRIYMQGCAQHVVQRGNNRSVCFYTDADYAFYLQKLQEAARTHQVAIHAFVLMTNHVHLLVTPASESGISSMMQALGRSYVRYINIMYRRTGTLWEGRYKASLVSSDAYFLAVMRYIEMNPVRARLVTCPHAHPWSSYRHNGMGKTIRLITEHALYQRLGETRAARMRAYRLLFINKERVVGNYDFNRQIEAACKRKINTRRWGGDRKSVGFKKNQVL
ncbi:MAG: transposase [Haliea sp.]|nr:transposase [Haliea sp.]